MAYDRDFRRLVFIETFPRVLGGLFHRFVQPQALGSFALDMQIGDVDLYVGRVGPAAALLAAANFSIG